MMGLTGGLPLDVRKGFAFPEVIFLHFREAEPRGDFLKKFLR
jgi:hypothetical protein